MNDSTQATLLSRLRDASDPVAWEQFFERYWRLVFTFARSRGCGEHTAEEVVQDVMLVVFERRDVFRYDPAKGRFRDWLLTVVRNKVGERRRRPSERVRGAGGDSQGAVAEVEANVSPVDEAWEAAFEQSLLTALLDVVRRDTNPRTYQAFELFALGGLPGAEVARITGLSRNAVYQARRNIFRRLGEMGQPYRDQGQLCRQLKEALAGQPEPVVERAVTMRVGQTLRSRWETLQ